LECEKLASEKIEIQRHYVMVSIAKALFVEEVTLGGSCSDVGRKPAKNNADAATRFLLVSLI
jgi:hypothetical protein